MVDDKLTPEEQAELQSLEAEFSEEAPLTPEEEAELASLEALEREPASSQYALPIEEQKELVPSDVTDEMSTLQQVGEIASDQIPFADQARAGAISFMNQQFGDGTKTYSQVKNDIDKKQAAIQAENPVMANSVRVATEAAQLIGPQALLFKGLRGIKAVSKIGKVAKAAGIAVGTDFTYNVAQELSQDDRDFLDKMDDAFYKGGKRTAEGAAYGVMLGGVFKSAGKIAKTTGLTDFVKDSIVKNNVGGLLKSQAKKVRGYTKASGRDMSDVRKSLEEVGGDALDYTKPMDIVEFVETTAGAGSTALKKAGEMQGDVVAKISAATGKTLDASAVMNNVNNVLDDAILAKGDFIDQEMIEQASNIKSLMARLSLNADGTIKFGTASEIATLKGTMKERLKALGIDETSGFGKRILKATNDGVNETIESAASAFDLSKAAGAADDATQVISKGEVVESLKDQFVNARKRYGDIKLLSEIADASNAEVGAGELFSSVRRGFYNALPLGRDAQIIGAMASVTNTLIKAPASIGSAAGATRKSAMRMAGLGKFLADNGSEIPAMGALSSRLYTLFTDDEQDYASANEEFKALIDQGYSYKSLFENPVQRTNMDAKSKISDIYNVVSSTAPSLANDLMDAYKNGEDLGPMLSEIAKRPEAKGLISPGIGWEGKVYSPEDKASAISKLKTEYPLISTSDRMLYEQNIEKTGNLPLWEELPQRQPMKFTIKDKGKPSY